MLCARILLEQRVIRHGTCVSLDAEPARRLEIDEQHSHVCRARNVAQRQEHAVAVVDRKRQLTRRCDAHEARRATLVRDCRPAALVHGGKKEHDCAFDEGAVVGIEFRMHQGFEPVREASAAVTVLIRTMGLAVEFAHRKLLEVFSAEYPTAPPYVPTGSPHREKAVERPRNGGQADVRRDPGTRRILPLRSSDRAYARTQWLRRRAWQHCSCR